MKANIYPGRGTLPDWNDLNIRQREQIPPRAYSITFPDLASCRHALTANRRYLSPYIINLADKWESRYYSDILQLPENILSFRSGFAPVSVPGGHAGASKPAEGRYAFPVTPPLVPASQPVLVYRRTFSLPLLWGGLRKRLVLAGIRGACHVFVNGRLIGYTQGSYLPAEFDMTAVLHDGDNELFILAYPQCTGSYLEHQDPDGCFGLVRDVYCEAVPAVSIQDVQLQTLPLPEDDAWRLDLRISLTSCRISTESPIVRVTLCQNEDCLSETTWPVVLKPADSQGYAAPVQTSGELLTSMVLTAIKPWNDENPELYDLFITIEERGGKELSCQHYAVGFRHLNRRADQLMINGRPLQLRAVQWPGRISRTIPELIRNLLQIKQNHLNALYVRDEPADPILLELCDIFGVYVIDEAPVDIAHPIMLQAMQEDPRWLQAAGESLTRLVRRDYNHPSVIFWSAGLFRQSRPAVDMLSSLVRKLDQTRWLHVLDLADCSRNPDQTPISEDCTYPFGGGQCFCDWERRSPQLQRALRQSLRPLQIRAVDAAAGSFMIANRLNWTTGKQFKVGWILLRDGQAILSGELDNIRMAPGTEQFIELYYGDEPFSDDGEYVLRFEVAYAADCLWAREGDEVSFQEFTLSSSGCPDTILPARKGGRLRLESERHHLIVSGNRFWMVFNRINGALESWRIGDKELIAATSFGYDVSGLHTTVWRSPEAMDEPLTAAWHQQDYADLIPQVISSQEGCDGQSAVIELVIRLAARGQPACLELLTRYEIRSQADLLLFTSLTPLQKDLPPLPCFSQALCLKPDYNLVRWLGTGPESCLSRWESCSRSGLYTLDLLSDQRTGHGPDSEPGWHDQTHWLSCRDASGFGLMIRSDQRFGHVVHLVGKPGLSEGRLERQSIAMQLFSPLPQTPAVVPVRATWQFNPVVSE